MVAAASAVAAASVVAADLHDVSLLQIWKQNYSFMKCFLNYKCTSHYYFILFAH
jgi:hypothetical protein